MKEKRVVIMIATEIVEARNDGGDCDDNGDDGGDGNGDNGDDNGEVIWGHKWTWGVIKKAAE